MNGGLCSSVGSLMYGDNNNAHAKDETQHDLSMRDFPNHVSNALNTNFYQDKTLSGIGFLNQNRLKIYFEKLLMFKSNVN